MPEKLYGLEIEILNGVYFPHQDTELALATIKQWVEKSEKNGVKFRKKRIKILEMGSGTGILGISLYLLLKSHFEAIEIVFVDIFDNAIKSTKINAERYLPSNSYKIVKSDLFASEFFNDSIKFDIVIFNPPYLPSFEDEIQGEAIITQSDLCWCGGKQGFETSIRFIEQLAKFCNNNAVLFLTSSTQTEQIPILNTLNNYGFLVIEKKELKVQFETIIEYVCRFDGIKK